MKCVIARAITFLLLLWGLPIIGNSKPLLEANSNEWDEKTRLFLGNCKAELPNTQEILPKTHWSPHSELLALAYVGAPKAKYSAKRFPQYAHFRNTHKNRPPVVYALANHGKLKGNLYQLDAKTGQELQKYDLPNMEQSSLFTADIYYNHAWCSFLWIQVNHDVWGFEVTDPKKTLKPIFKIALQEIFTSVKLVRLKDQFGVLVGGRLNNQSVLLLSLMDDQGTGITQQTWALTDPPRFIVPVDENGIGRVNKVYISDQKALWELDLNVAHPLLAKKWDIEILAAPWVLRETTQPQNKLIFLANHGGKEGIYHFGLDTDFPSTKLKLIASGQYSDIRVRYGRLLVIPKDHKVLPKIFTLPNYLSKEIAWCYLYQGKASSEEIVYARLFWDSKQAKDILITLNLSGQLNILETTLNKGQASRVVWRKLAFLQENKENLSK
jgi:hypothetical protein